MEKQARPFVYLIIVLMLMTNGLVGIPWSAAAMTITTTQITPGFVITNIVPTVTGITPKNGSTGGGTKVTITGTNFTGATSVKFGSAAAIGVTVNDSTSITATSPSGSAGVVNVTVITPKGVSATNSNDQFTYTAQLTTTLIKPGFEITSIVPTVTGITPKSGSTSGGTKVTITGTNFTGATAVKFGSAVATGVTVNGSTSITATSPAGSAGVVNVSVVTPKGASATNSNDQFTYMALKAAVVPKNSVNVTSISPLSNGQYVIHFPIGSSQDTTMTVQSNQGSMVPLSSLPQGVTVNLAGYTWIVLDPSTGFLLMQGAYQDQVPFDSSTNCWHACFFPENPNNAGNVCTCLYATLSPADQAMIIPHNWTLSEDSKDTNPVPAVYDYIGLLSYDEYKQYQTVAGVNTNFAWWTRTPWSQGPDARWVWHVKSGGGLQPKLLMQSEYVRPAIYVNPDMQLIISGYTASQ